MGKRYGYYYIVYYQHKKGYGNIEISLTAPIEKSKMNDVGKFIKEYVGIENQVIVTGYSFMFKLRY